MNNEDVCLASRVAWNVKEVDVVLSKSHDRLVVRGCEASSLDCLPSRGTRSSLGDSAEVQLVEAPTRKTVEHVRVVVEDGDDRGGVDARGRHL